MCDRCKVASPGENAQDAVDSYLKSDTKWHLKNENVLLAQYTPLLAQMMFELYQYPHMRSHYLYSTSLPMAQQEVVELLKRAEIIVIKEAPPVAGAIPIWGIDEDAMRAYVNAVCNVPLPTKTWVIR